MTTNGTDAPRPAAAGQVPQAGAANGVDVATLSFDEALLELQRTVTELEEGGLPLERTLELYERGAALHGRCAMLLDEAELRVRRLVDGPAGRPVVVDEPDGDERTDGAEKAAAEDGR